MDTHKKQLPISVIIFTQESEIQFLVCLLKYIHRMTVVVFTTQFYNTDTAPVSFTIRTKQNMKAVNSKLSFYIHQ